MIETVTTEVGVTKGAEGKDAGAGTAGRYTVVVADRVSPSGLGSLLEDDRFEVLLAHDWEPGRVEEALARAHGLVVRSGTRVTRRLLGRAPVLEVVGRAGVGVDNIDLEAATERGVAVLNAPAGNTVSAAELAMALVLSTVRRIPEADRTIREGRWERSRFAGVELRGKTLGLVGAGRIGGEVARRARAFGMVVVVHDPWLTDERADDLGVARMELDALLGRADVVSLHVPLTDETRGMIDADRIGRMKAGAFLVNASRGGVVDEHALARALVDGRLGGAALDVYAEEPLPEDSPLRAAPGLVLTPHLGASTAEAQKLVAEEIAGAVRDALLQGDLSRALNAPRIGGEALRRLRPVFELGERIGRLAAVLSTGGSRGVEVRYHGVADEAVKPLASHALKGFLGVILGADQVNFVNAPHLARARGIGLATHHLARRTDYTEFVEVLVAAEGGRVRVAGALLGEGHPRIVRIDEYHVDITPRGSLVVLRNRDVPGVIGRVGTLLGSLRLNIAEYHQARLSEGGEALAVVAVDGAVGREVVTALEALDEVLEARSVNLR
ncbi:MAG: phosphoglycerate dehydrogenase [Gemmatimonadota bacterium]|jgi:D-3-phosphoglycerate dehydrogenase